MKLAPRRSEFDVTNQINTTVPAEVDAEVRRLFVELYPQQSHAVLARVFQDCAQLYRGEHAHYRACDTAYHDMQHVLDVTLAMARLMNGYERSRNGSEPIGAVLFSFGIVTALFHDIGYLRHRHDTRHHNGGEYTLRHVSRGARFLEQYMIAIGMPELAPIAAKVIHFTGYEIAVSRIDVPSSMFRLLGNMLGSADILAQMADRCYLEKCRDRLYPEFVAGGLACQDRETPRASTAVFSSVEHLLYNTPGFYRTAKVRLSDHLGGADQYVRSYFGGQNFYVDEIEKNIRYAERVAKDDDLTLLRRIPPACYGSAQPAALASATPNWLEPRF